MKRRIYTAEHESLRAVATDIFRDEIDNNLQQWLQDGCVDRMFFQRLGDHGFIGLRVPERFGGSGLDTYSYNVVLSQAAAAAHLSLVGFRVHSELVIPYLLTYGTAEQTQRWVPAMVSGTTIGAIAMSESGTGSDLAGIKTSAVRDGDHYVVNGSKTFISNGTVADLIVLVVRTSPATSADRRGGLSLLVIESTMEGYSTGKPLKKLGLPYGDTAELFFDNVRVPVGNLLGEEGAGFGYLSFNLPQERISIAAGAVAMSRTALTEAIAYASDRVIFGNRLGSFQNTKFVLAEVATEVEAAEQLLDRAVEELDTRELTAADAAKVKLFCTEVQARAVDKCLQVHGGYGFMSEYAIAGMYADARVTRIYGGSSEVMKSIISKDLGVGVYLRT